MLYPPSAEELAALPHPRDIFEKRWQDVVIQQHYTFTDSHWYAAAFEPEDRVFHAYIVPLGNLRKTGWADVKYDDLDAINVYGKQVVRERHWWPRRAAEVRQIVAAYRLQRREKDRR